MASVKDVGKRFVIKTSNGVWSVIKNKKNKLLRTSAYARNVMKNFLSVHFVLIGYEIAMPTSAGNVPIQNVTRRCMAHAKIVGKHLKISTTNDVPHVSTKRDDPRKIAKESVVNARNYCQLPPSGDSTTEMHINGFAMPVKLCASVRGHRVRVAKKQKHAFRQVTKRKHGVGNMSRVKNIALFNGRSNKNTVAHQKADSKRDSIVPDGEHVY